MDAKGKATELDYDLLEYTEYGCIKKGIEDKLFVRGYIETWYPDGYIISEKGVERLKQVGLLKAGETAYKLQNTDELDRLVGGRNDQELFIRGLIVNGGWMVSNGNKVHFYHSLKHALESILIKIESLYQRDRTIFQFNKDIPKKYLNYGYINDGYLANISPIKFKD